MKDTTMATKTETKSTELPRASSRASFTSRSMSPIAASRP